MIDIALAYEDGRIGVMQYLGDDTDNAILATIAKMVDRPTEWRRITAEEAAAIRATRPKPAFQPGSTRVPDHPAPVSADDLARMLAELDAHKAEVRAMIDGLLSNIETELDAHKAEVRAMIGGLLSNIETEVVRSTQAGET